MEERNIIWKGQDEPPHQISIGILPTLTMPPEAEQRAGFYSEHALVLIKNNDGYKAFVELKGDASSPDV